MTDSIIQVRATGLTGRIKSALAAITPMLATAELARGRQARSIHACWRLAVASAARRAISPRLSAASDRDRPASRVRRCGYLSHGTLRIVRSSDVPSRRRSASAFRRCSFDAAFRQHVAMNI